jgi:CemA family
MKNWPLKNIEKSIFEKTGVIPRSIFKMFDGFKNQLDPIREKTMIEELRVSRYQSLASIRYLCLLCLNPLLVNTFSKILIFGPLIDYWWQKQEFTIFLNPSQQIRAFEELQTFEEKLRFDILIGKEQPLSIKSINIKIRNKANEVAKHYNQETKDSIKNILADALSTTTFFALIRKNKRQLTILYSVFNEILYGLSDTAKSFFIILFTDVFVGYHSSHGWEILLETLLRHFGLPENREFIFLFIATFPVVLDTIFKYWIFRYLNRVSPSAVATYRNMNE